MITALTMAGMVSSSADPSQHQMMTTASTIGTVTTAISVLNTTAMTTNSTIRDENLALIEVATLGTLFVLIVFGNCCVLLALALRPLKMTRMYYYLLHLCISDLITGFFTVLPQLAWDITYRFNGGNILCKAIKCTQILGPYLSSYVLVVTAIDRYQAICFPLSNCSWTPRRSKLMIACAWIISIVCSAPQAFFFSYQEIPHLTGVYDCWGTFPQPFGERIYVTWYAVSVFFVPLAVLVFTHFYICREIWVNVSLKRKTDKNREKQFNDYNNSKQLTANDNRPKHCVITFNESMHNSSPRVNTVNRLSRAKIKTVKITVVVILCYITCSSPFIFVQLWAYWVPSAQNSDFWADAFEKTIPYNLSLIPMVWKFDNSFDFY
ncbi:unnamed protein product [Medioppia subpectinata]|uniref:G-protein coupled receptors family 1 profile domain-containing protein n=1 Tax=Medioppia subpectinata TaxID=1979941 RepID=A0A7R9L6C4_9ACAR|nr:unnamed protein product [Medioppia subpectinata]CAG2116167.1 unnamed protein product [Medioppia subpectinata]